MEDLAGLLPLLVLGLLAYLLFIRPARNRAKDVQKLQNALSAGDEVMLTSGLFGTVEYVDTEEERVHVEISPGVSVTVHRGAIGKIIHDVPADDPGPVEDDPDVSTTHEDPPAQSADGDDSSNRGAN